ncbi:hypothetical protein JCM30471_35370 [Desulfuromonas carbonis]
MPWLQTSAETVEPKVSRTPQEARARIQALASRSRLGQWGLVAFLLLSLAVFRIAPWFAELPQKWRNLLGPSPPVKLISFALAVYAFAALIYILARMMAGGMNFRGWSHLGYCAGFYLFYGYAGALEENFWAVFAAGLTIFALEYYRIWSHCNEALRRERKSLKALERQQGAVPEDGA